MNIDQLIKMANQIGNFFDAFLDRTQAVQGVAQHISRTWEPRMRTALLEHAEGSDGQGLDSIVREALPLIAEPRKLDKKRPTDD